MGRRIGYARVSTAAQKLDVQLRALRASGCKRIFKDHGVSAIAKRRPGFEAALDALRPGDVLVVQRLDRAFRSVADLVRILETLEARGVQFLSLSEALDSRTPMGKAFIQIGAVFAELERSIVSERTKAGLEVARASGKTLGRPRTPILLAV